MANEKSLKEMKKERETKLKMRQLFRIFLSLIMFSLFLLSCQFSNSDPSLEQMPPVRQDIKLSVTNTLMFSAHFDDEILSLGLLNRAIEEGRRANIIYLSLGIPHQNSTRRLRDSLEARSIIGMSKEMLKEEKNISELEDKYSNIIFLPPQRLLGPHNLQNDLLRLKLIAESMTDSITDNELLTVITGHPEDNHPDHRYNFRLVSLILVTPPLHLSEIVDNSYRYLLKDKEIAAFLQDEKVLKLKKAFADQEIILLSVLTHFGKWPIGDKKNKGFQPQLKMPIPPYDAPLFDSQRDQIWYEFDLTQDEFLNKSVAYWQWKSEIQDANGAWLDSYDYNIHPFLGGYLISFVRNSEQFFYHSPESIQKIWKHDFKNDTYLIPYWSFDEFAIRTQNPDLSHEERRLRVQWFEDVQNNLRNQRKNFISESLKSKYTEFINELYRFTQSERKILGLKTNASLGDEFDLKNLED